MINYHNALLHVNIDRYMFQINTLDFSVKSAWKKLVKQYLLSNLTIWPFKPPTIGNSEIITHVMSNVWQAKMHKNQIFFKIRNSSYNIKK